MASNNIEWVELLIEVIIVLESVQYFALSDACIPSLDRGSANEAAWGRGSSCDTSAHKVP